MAARMTLIESSGSKKGGFNLESFGYGKHHSHASKTTRSSVDSSRKVRERTHSENELNSAGFGAPAYGSVGAVDHSQGGAGGFGSQSGFFGGPSASFGGQFGSFSGPSGSFGGQSGYGNAQGGTSGYGSAGGYGENSVSKIMVMSRNFKKSYKIFYLAKRGNALSVPV
jgi:hypothetical protein